MATRVTIGERRARLAWRHRLAPDTRAHDPVDVATDLVALHATDPATVYLSLWARLADPTVSAVEDALYGRRTLVRMLGMRRTMFVVPRDLVPVVQAAASDSVAAEQRRVLVKHLTELTEVSNPAIWLEDVCDATVRALAARGEAVATELAADEPRLRTKLGMAAGKSYGATVNVTSRVLTVLGAEGRIVRGRPRGSWISSQYRWSTVERWLPDLQPWPAAEARTELARRWLSAYGPAPLSDLRWWTGWNAGDVKKAVAGLNVSEVELEDGGPGVVLASEGEAVPAATGPWVALLPTLDPTVMGWQARDWYLGPYAPLLFDRSGNPGPTVWVDGRIVGGWAHGPDGTVRYRLLEDVGSEAAGAIEDQAGRLSAWLGPVRVTPRFRTPLERELST